ncbi:putative glucan endo-1,3-beta-glucosidase GVI [Fagus crenata]
MRWLPHSSSFASLHVSSLLNQVGVGVNYGLLGDNLPAPDATIGLLKSRNITKARIFDPNPDVLRALEGSNIEVVLGVRNEDLQQLASDKNAATSWVANNVVPHFPAVKFRYITAGNEVIPGPLATFVYGAMQNLDAALKSANITVPVSTAVSYGVMGAAFPPSSGAFLDSELEVMGSIVSFLSKNRSPLLANVYPYYTYANDPVHVRLDYALGTSQHKVVADGLNQYTILLDAMVDAMYAALEKRGGQDVRIVVSESGWPSAGNGDIATLANAQTYVNNLIAHVSSGLGMPRRPGSAMETYVFALFNEDLKPSGTEQNFGLFHPDMTEVYPVSFA